MSEFLSVFGVYDFAIREGLVLCLVALAVYVLLRAGIFAVPQVGMMAIGAYTSAILSTDAGLPVPVAVAVGALAAGAAGVALAGLLARLDGIYLAIASIAFSEVVRVAVLNVPATGGPQGKVAIPREVDDLWLCGAVTLAVLGLLALQRSRTGLAMSAMRVDNLMAQHQGFDTARIRTTLFGVSGLLAGAGGALQVHMSGFVEPGQFDFELLTELLAIVVIGGMTYLGGTFVGAAVVLGLPFALEAFAEYQVIVNGLAIVLVVAFAPHGLIGSVARLMRRRPSAPLAAATTGPAASLTGPTPAETPSGTAALIASALEVSFGGVRALQGVSLSVQSGEVLGVIGPNGSGKTTLINALSGAYRPASGEGTVDDVPLAPRWGRPHLLTRAGVSRTFQTIRLMEDESVRTNVTLGVRRSAFGERHEIVAALLSRLGLTHVADHRAGELPYGMRREVEIARALARQPSVLLLDEPTAGMSTAERERVFEVIASARDAGIAVIVVEHDVAMMRRFCDRLLVLDFGQLLAEGTPAEVLKTKEVVDAYVGSSTH